MNQYWKTGLAIFLGSLVGNYVWHHIQEARREEAIKAALVEMQRTMAESDRTGKELLQAAQLKQAKERAAEQQRQQVALQDQAATQRQMAEARIAANLRKQDKEDAWKRFFQQSESCKQNSLQGDCADAYIKAKAAFESQYQSTR